MKAVTKGSIVRVLLFGLLSLFTLVYLVLSTEYGRVTIITSPDKKFTAYCASSASEGGVAPYGTHIFVAPWWQPFAQYYKEPVFAGYCEPKVRWKYSQELIIQYSVKNKRAIKIQELSYKGIRIKYQTTTTQSRSPATHSDKQDDNGQLL